MFSFTKKELKQKLMECCLIEKDSVIQIKGWLDVEQEQDFGAKGASFGAKSAGFSFGTDEI